jgi:hypothetical protein
MLTRRRWKLEAKNFFKIAETIWDFSIRLFAQMGGQGLVFGHALSPFSQCVFFKYKHCVCQAGASKNFAL